MTDRKLERDRKMRVSYEFARMGDTEMAMKFANSAHLFFPVTKAQWERLDLLLKAYQNQGGLVLVSNNTIAKR